MYSPIPEENCQVINVIVNPLSGGDIVTRMDTSKYDPTALQLFLYYDEVELANPLGSKTGKHKLGLCLCCVFR